MNHMLSLGDINRPDSLFYQECCIYQSATGGCRTAPLCFCVNTSTTPKGTMGGRHRGSCFFLFFSFFTLFRYDLLLPHDSVSNFERHNRFQLGALPHSRHNFARGHN